MQVPAPFKYELASSVDPALALLRATIFTDAERVIADSVVRNRGTIGDTLCRVDPSAGRREHSTEEIAN